MIVDLTWANFKTHVTDKGRVRFIDRDSFYKISFIDNGGELETSVLKDGGADQVDFETNYKPYGNKPAASQSVITSIPAFAAKVLPDGNKLFKRVVGIRSDLVAGDNTIVWVNPYNWAKFMAAEVVGGEAGDYVDVYVLDSTSGSITSVPNYVLNQFAFTTNIAKDFYQHKSEFDADIYLGLQIKFVYHSVSAKTIGINFILNEVKP
jgi:hypothetical protein